MAGEPLLPPPPPNTGGGGGGGGGTTPPAAAATVNYIVARIQQPDPKAMLAMFPYRELDKIEGRPDYNSLVAMREQSVRNASKVESKFGGGKKGHVGMVLKPRIYDNLDGTVPWNVPKSRGLRPIRPPGVSDEEWQAIQLEFVDDEENIRKAKCMQTLIRNQMVEALVRDCLEELRDPYTEFDERTIHEMFDHLFEEYGELGITERENTMNLFRSGPDWTKSIDTLYARQQKCMTIMEDSFTPISENDMVQQLVDHVAKSGIVTKARQKWERHIKANPADRNWKFAKLWFRREFKDVRRAEQDVSIDGAVMQAQLRQSQRDILKKEVLEEITPALDRIASSAACNQSDREMIAAMTADNVTVTSKLNAIMADNARLKATVESMKNSQSAGANDAVMAENVRMKAEVQRMKATIEDMEIEAMEKEMAMSTGGTKTDPEPSSTAGKSPMEGLPMELNSRGVLCPVRYGRERDGQMKYMDKIFFLDRQYCTTCQRDVWHLPRYCPGAQEGKKRRADAASNDNDGGKRGRA